MHEEIIWNGMTIRERLRSVPLCVENEAPSEIDMEAWRQWRESFSGGDASSFAKRTAQLPNPTLLAQAFAANPPQTFTQPRWYGIAQALINSWAGEAFTSSGHLFPMTSAFEVESDLPFQEIFRDAVKIARSVLGSNLKQRGEGNLQKVETHWSAHAYLALERQLLQTLVGVCSQTLYEEFVDSAGLFGVRLMGLLGHAIAGDREDRKYTLFMATLMSGGMLTLLRKYPVLICLIAKKICYWSEATADLLLRFINDRERIAGMLGLHPSSIEVVSDVETGLSDPHAGGRTVAILTFKGGERCMYKPRSLYVDAICQRFFKCFNSLSEIQLRTPQSVDCGEYGFVEFVKYSPCKTSDEVLHFYKRMGALLAVAQQLRISDLHHENIIACGAFPVLIDIETAFAPQSATEFDTLLRTGILTEYKVDRRNNLEINIGGVSGGDIGRCPKRTWANVNSDTMSEVVQSSVIKESQNVAVLGTERVVPAHYLQQIIQGYQDSARLLHEQNERFVSNSGPWSDLKQCRTRFIRRDTNAYLLKIDQQLHPSSLHSGIKYTIVVDELFRGALSSKCDEQSLLDLEHETAALADLDVPVFTVESKAPPSIAAEQIPLQVRLIEESLLEKQLPPPLLNEGDFGAECLTDQAIAIADEVLDRSIDTPEGLVWFENFGTGLSEHDYAARKESLNRCLYDGAIGTGILFGAAYKETGTEKYRDAAIRCISPVLKKRDFRRSGLGAGLGLGGHIYASTLLADLLDDRTLLENSSELVLGVTDEEIETDLDLDVMSGVAGLGFGALKLYSRVHDVRILDVAIRCGDRLQRMQRGGAWESKIEHTPLTGFSHGAAGCTAFLSRLSHFSNSNGLKSAIERGLNWENGHFVTTHQNWADLRRLNKKASKPRYNVNMWCNGATGIGFGRLASLRLSHVHEISLLDIRRAVVSLSGSPQCSLDHLCCGEFGRLDYLLTASIATDCQETRRQLEICLRRSLLRIQKSGWHLRIGERRKASAFSPGFFTGIAGIGYTLLRLASPNTFPSVLSFE